MLIAYLDEFGHQGPFVSATDKKFSEHPLFGYAGYILPAENIRRLGGFFEHQKEILLDWEIRRSQKHPRRWEKKGAQLLTTQNINRYGEEIIPSLRRIFRRLGNLNGNLVFFGQEKPIGPVSVTNQTSQEREEHCLIQTIRRIGTFASERNEKVLIIMDATETDNRERAVSTLGKIIYGRGNPDTNSILEVPLQADSHLYGTIQLADWICALLNRLTHYHFVTNSQFHWSVPLINNFRQYAPFTTNSVVWLNNTRSGRCYSQHLTSEIPFWKSREY